MDLDEVLELHKCCGVKNQILSRDGDTCLCYCPICNTHVRMQWESAPAEDCKELLDALESTPEAE